MKGPNVTQTNGRYEFHGHARGILMLADPPEAGWRIQSPSGQTAACEAERLAAFGCESRPNEARDLASTSVVR